MPRPRAQLDTAALARAFAEGGLHGTSIDAVAAAAGLAKPTLYARGGDKEELFALAVETEVERLLDRLDGVSRLLDLARTIDGYLLDAPEGARLLLVTGRVGAAGRVSRSLDRVLDALGAVLPPVFAGAVLGGAYSALHGGPSVEELARLLPPADDEGPPAGIWTA
jgi:AcrR family transcriptional regulator